MDFSSTKGKERAADDGFFMERLEMLYEQSLGDLRAFAEREGRTYEEVKKRMAELHCRSLFADPGANDPASMTERKELTSQVLQGISQQFESLERLANMQSFFLVISPDDPDDEGFLGGTPQGREFWRGYRGCGVAGARVFKTQCARTRPQAAHPVPTASLASAPVHATMPASSASISGAPRKKAQSAREVKTELYVAMRDALRTTCGIRTAEMKWTNHSNLYVYGVRIDGWPEDIPQQNPSTLSTAHNRRILDLLNEGKLSFVRFGNAAAADVPATADEVPEQDEDAIFEDSIDYSWAVGEADGDTGQTVVRPTTSHDGEHPDRDDVGNQEAQSTRATPCSTDGSLARPLGDPERLTPDNPVKRRRIESDCL